MKTTKTDIKNLAGYYEEELSKENIDVAFFSEKIELLNNEEVAKVASCCDVYQNFKIFKQAFIKIVGLIRTALIRFIKFMKTSKLTQKAITLLESIDFRKMPDVCHNLEKMGLTINCPVSVR